MFLMALENIFKFFLGLLFLVGAVLLVVMWWGHFVSFVLGGIPILLAMIAAVFILLGIEK